MLAKSKVNLTCYLIGVLAHTEAGLRDNFHTTVRNLVEPVPSAFLDEYHFP